MKIDKSASEVGVNLIVQEKAFFCRAKGTQRKIKKGTTDYTDFTD